MKRNIKGTALFILIFLSATMVNAQKGNFSTAVTAGISTPVLDNGIGIHLGINPCLTLSQYFAFEGQISYTNSKITRTFISGSKRVDSSVNTLAGSRMYFNSNEKKIRPFVNFLIGGIFSKEQINGIDQKPEFGLGLSTGAFVKMNKFFAGISYDTPGNYILQVGYTI